MATIKKFEDLEIWQLARQLNVKLQPTFATFFETRNFELKNQMERSAGSVMDNIAEGFEREGNKEFLQFLYISKGSLGEVRSQLYRTLDKKLISSGNFESLLQDCNILAAKIAKFVTYLKNSELKGNKFKR
jgi:four helix bundle protein